jgi:RNA polymerase sigma-54 factor
VDLEVVAEALEVVQSFDPIGCGSRDLAECLLLQARFHFPEDETFVPILSRHLQNLERRNYPAIARDLGIDVEDVQEYHRMIRELEPTPGRGYSTDTPRYISPDVTVERRNGEWHVDVNDDGVPELRVNRTYERLLRNASKQDREYLLDKLRGAEFLIKSVHKRRRTIRRVMEAILRAQRDFFEVGSEALRPLVLQEIADEVGVHMSTVSRVTTNKYVHTPHGIFELKYFFSGGVRQVAGEDLASEAIKVRIRALIQAEPGDAPLSDQDITDLLRREGIRLARRTVAKYRESLHILPSSQRRTAF